MNILSHHDTINRIQEKVKHLEHEQITDKSRIEALENWFLKQNDKICELEQNNVRVDKNGVLERENADIKDFEKIISSLEIDISNLKDKANVKLLKQSPNRPAKSASVAFSKLVTWRTKFCWNMQWRRNTIVPYITFLFKDDDDDDEAHKDSQRSYQDMQLLDHCHCH